MTPAAAVTLFPPSLVAWGTPPGSHHESERPSFAVTAFLDPSDLTPLTRLVG